MFFPERISNIKPSDLVLEIGPGGTPHPRSDVLLEKSFSDPTDAAWQRGLAPELKTDKKVIFYNGGRFPFKDHEFDYIICSHVLEHVEDVEFFISELFRVAPKGYLEFPAVYYEYLYNFPVHLNLLSMKHDVLVYLPKKQTSLSDFAPIHALFIESLKKGYSQLVDDLKMIMFEGFEWTRPFAVRKALSLADVTPADVRLPSRPQTSRSKRITSFFQNKLNILKSR